MSVRLYHFPPSFCSQKVRLALEEKGVEWESRLVDIGVALENYKPWYAELNPGLVVPTLEHEGDVITDSARIVRYIDQTFKGPDLVPEESPQVDMMDRWIERIDEFPFRELSYGTMPSFAAPFREGSFDKRRSTIREHMEEAPELQDVYEAKLDDIDQWQEGVESPSEVESILVDLENMIGDLDERLRDSKWVAGGHYSLADILVTIALGRLDMMGFDELVDNEDKFGAVAGYYRRVQGRPFFEAADVWSRFQALTLFVLLLRALWVKLKR